MPFCCYKPLERKLYFEHVLQTCCWGSDETNELLINENRNPTAEHFLSLCMHYSGMYYPQTPEFPPAPPKVNATCLHLEFNTFLCRACSQSRWDIWGSFSRAQWFFSSCHLKDLSCFLQELRDNGWIWVEWNGLFWWLIQARDSLQRLEYIAKIYWTICGKIQASAGFQVIIYCPTVV